MPLKTESFFMLDIGYYTSEALTLLQALIGIPSISREEEAAADFLQNYIEETGIMTGRSGNNIWCISPMFDTQRPTILLNSHIDTVKPVNGWRKLPFTPKMENGKLYGLGSNDAGASLVSLFQTYRYLCATEQSYNLIFLASCEEEVSGKNGLESALRTELLAHTATGCVYVYDPAARTVEKVLGGVAGAAGLALSPDGSTLYVSDLGSRCIWAVDAAARELTAGQSARFSVRIRYRQPLQGARLFVRDEGAYLVFDRPQRGITPGQFAAWYDGDQLVGSGVIEG